MPTTDYKAAALSRWPQAKLWGSGDRQFAAVRFVNGEATDAYLCATEQQAKNIILGFERGKVFNLEPTPIPLNCRELGYE